MASTHHDPHRRKSRFAALDDHPRISNEELAIVLKEYAPFPFQPRGPWPIKPAPGCRLPKVKKGRGQPKVEPYPWLTVATLPVLQLAAHTLAKRLKGRNRGRSDAGLRLTELMGLQRPNGVIKRLIMTLRCGRPLDAVPGLIGLFRGVNVSQRTLKARQAAAFPRRAELIPYPIGKPGRKPGKLLPEVRSAEYVVNEIRSFLKSRNRTT